MTKSAFTQLMNDLEPYQPKFALDDDGSLMIQNPADAQEIPQHLLRRAFDAEDIIRIALSEFGEFRI